MTTGFAKIGILIIGNEILSGETADKNLHFLCSELTTRGYKVSQAEVVLDETQEILEALKRLKAKNDFVITTGGIGPTHDDITAACVAEFCGVELVYNTDAEALMLIRKPQGLNERSKRMAYIPEGASLIKNSVSAAPGFMIDGIIALAGVPSIMQAMFLELVKLLPPASRLFRAEIYVACVESQVADLLEDVEKQFAIQVGSYPKSHSGVYFVKASLRSRDQHLLQQAQAYLQEKLAESAIQYFPTQTKLLTFLGIKL